MDKAVFIDTNIFLEIFLKDSKWEKCEDLLKMLREESRIAVTTDFIMYSCLLIVQNKTKNGKKLKNVISFFNSYSNLAVIRPSFEDWFYAAELMESKKLDFDDSLVVACMKRYEIGELASLDKHFDKLKEIKRSKL